MRAGNIGMSPLFIFFNLFAFAYSIFILGPIQYGVKWVFLKAVRGESFQVKDIFSVFDNYLNILLANLLVGAIVVAGFFFLIVPGIVFACKLAFVPYLVMDRKLDPVEAVKQSWNMTSGHSWTIFAMALVSIFIFIGGLLLVGVGAIFAGMWVSAAFAAIYYAVTIKPNGNGNGEIVPQAQ